MLTFRDHFIIQCRCIRHQDARWLRPPSLIVQAGIGAKVQGLLGLLSSCRHGDWGCRAEGGRSQTHCSTAGMVSVAVFQEGSTSLRGIEGDPNFEEWAFGISPRFEDAWGMPSSPPCKPLLPLPLQLDGEKHPHRGLCQRFLI